MTERTIASSKCPVGEVLISPGTLMSLVAFPGRLSARGRRQSRVVHEEMSGCYPVASPVAVTTDIISSEEVIVELSL